MKRVFVVASAIIGAFIDHSKVNADPIPQIPQTNLYPDVKFQITPETSSAIKTLIQSNKIEILPNGQILIKAITVNDLKNMGLITESLARDGNWTPGSYTDDGMWNPEITSKDAIMNASPTTPNAHPQNH